MNQKMPKAENSLNFKYFVNWILVHLVDYDIKLILDIIYTIITTLTQVNTQTGETNSRDRIVLEFNPTTIFSRS